MLLISIICTESLFQEHSKVHKPLAGRNPGFFFQAYIFIWGIQKDKVSRVAFLPSAGGTPAIPVFRDF
jgi:hypothetical protein